MIVDQVPLGRILDATAYVSGGRWERRGPLYSLRPPTPREAVTDSGRYVAALDTLGEYLATVDSDDLSLPEGVRVELANFRQEFAAATADTYWPPPVPEDVVGDWQVRSKERGLAIMFRNVDKRDDGETGTRNTWSWGWQNAK